MLLILGLLHSFVVLKYFFPKGKENDPLVRIIIDFFFNIFIYFQLTEDSKKHENETSPTCIFELNIYLYKCLISQKGYF